MSHDSLDRRQSIACVFQRSASRCLSIGHQSIAVPGLIASRAFAIFTNGTIVKLVQPFGTTFLGSGDLNRSGLRSG
ncbi:hypothetical protein MKK88_04935 [Methylobacterium sp. E-005]|jgi:hypothetical protein|uniref:hypothetical protein n=1 Tax=Methylobacterium sp. E-005 TaxID=2836549 RepID=UPI001FBB269C|nr:hypothetical protein [Methylobacterium sp. E-005]MCJ2085340.1 hypothetical protein [Methylobacterium sp. E-005]